MSETKEVLSLSRKEEIHSGWSDHDGIREKKDVRKASENRK